MTRRVRRIWKVIRFRRYGEEPGDVTRHVDFAGVRLSRRARWFGRCGSFNNPPTSPGPQRFNVGKAFEADTANAVTAVIAGVPTLKPVPAGLHTRNGIPSSHSVNGVNHTFLNVNWADIETSDGTHNWGTIDNVLDALPVGSFAKFRIFSGRNAPTWVKNAVGSVKVTNPHDNITGTVPKFWTQDYFDIYESFMDAVATRYDNDSRVLDIVCAGAMTIFAEPFIRAGDHAESNLNLWNAGLNETTDRAAIKESVHIVARQFVKTRFSLATHLAWQIVDGTLNSPYRRTSWELERDILNDLRGTYGNRLIIQNNGLCQEGCSGSGGPNAGNVWCWMKGAAKPKGFQVGGKGNDSITLCLDNNLALGGHFSEHASFSELTDSQMKKYDEQLKAAAEGVP